MSYSLLILPPTVNEIPWISVTVVFFLIIGILHTADYFKFHINVIILSIYSRYMHYD